MSDWTGFLRSDDFRAYRKKQAEAVAGLLQRLAFQTLSNGQVEPAELRGMMKIINLLVNLPKELTKDKKTLELLSGQMTEDTATIAQYLIRCATTE